MSVVLDDTDKLLLNNLQAGFPVSPRPFKEVGEKLGLSEAEVLEKLRSLLARGAITRLGPILNPRRLGGDSTLAAMSVPKERLEQVINLVNSYTEVSHNYERDHNYNMWFVVSSTSKEKVLEVLSEIEESTGIKVLNMPMIEEYFIGVNFQFSRNDNGG